MRKLVLFLAIFTVVGCSNPTDKSVIDVLSESELKKVDENNEVFRQLYAFIRNRVDEIKEKDSLAYINLKPITYGRVYNFLFSDSAIKTEMIQQIVTEWDGKYAGIEDKADSVIDYWKNEISNSMLGSVDIKYLGKKEVKNEKTNIVTGLKIGFKANSPQLGTLKNISFNLYFSPYNDAWDDVRCMHINLDSSAGGYVDVPFDYKNYFSVWKGAPEDYKYEVLSVNGVKGECSLETLNVPVSVRNYLDSEMQNLNIFLNSKDEIIKELIDSNYENKDSYVQGRAFEIMREKDKEVFDLFVGSSYN